MQNTRHAITGEKTSLQSLKGRTTPQDGDQDDGGGIDFWRRSGAPKGAPANKGLCSKSGWFGVANVDMIAKLLETETSSTMSRESNPLSI
jgi:hypothetical protein